MPFKHDWETTRATNPFTDDDIRAMVVLWEPEHKVLSYECTSLGCRNLNFKIKFEHSAPVILRVYLGDPDAAIKEQKIGACLRDTLPVPKIKFIGSFKTYNFAITEFLPGITLRDLLLSGEAYDLEVIMQDLSEMLAYISEQPWEKNTDPIDCLTFVQNCLENKNFSLDLCVGVNQYIKKNAKFLPDDNIQHLVHGDFGVENILVHQKDAQWRVSGILDWEFAFSGSKLWDIANLLRYRHMMPEGFTHAITSYFQLSEQSEKTIDLLNLIALIDCLDRTDFETQPKRRDDVLSLIEGILEQGD